MSISAEEPALLSLIDRPLLALPVDSTVDAAVARLATDRPGALVIVDQDRPVGLVTQATLITAWQQGLPGSSAIARLMIAPVATIGHDQPLHAAWDLCVAQGPGPIVVVDADARALGLLEPADLLRAAGASGAPGAAPEQLEQLHQAQSVARVGSWSLDLTRNRLEWSAETYRIFGLEPGRRLDYGAFLDRVHPDDQERVDRAWQQALAGEPYQIEHRLLVDGAVRWVREQAELERDTSGRAVRGVGTVQDITERKQAELKLQGLTQQLERLSRFATELISTSADQSAAAIDRMLAELGRFVAADRAYIFRYDEAAGIAINTSEWCGEGIEPQIDRLQRVALSDMQDWLETHRRDQPLVVEDVTALAPGPVRNLLETQAIQSLATLPLMSGGQCIGFVGFDSVRTHRHYEDDALELLALFARILANHHERHQAQARIIESEQNFRNFFDTIADLLFILDADTNIVHANDQVIHRLGYSRDELIGRSILSLHPQDRREEARRTITEMLAGKRDDCPVPLRCRDGTIIPVETRIATGRWNGGPALFGVTRDLSELAASEEKFAQAFHLSPVAMAITEIDAGTFIEVNTAFSQSTGFSRDEVIGSSSEALGFFVDPEQRDRIVAQVRATGEAVAVEIEFRHRNGDLGHGLFNAGLLTLQEREVMLSQMLDISDRKAAQEALLQERGLLRTLIDTLPDLVWLKGLEGSYLTCNRRFEELYRLPLDQVLGHTDFDLTDAATAEHFRDSDAQALKTNRPHRREESLTFNGYRGLFDTVKTPMHDASGRLLGVLGVARDITRQRESDERLRLAAKVFYHAHEGIMICDRSMRIVEVNPVFSEITGYAADTVLGKRPNFLDSGRHSRGFYRAIWKQVSAQGYWQDEIWNRHQDGHLYACLMTLSKVVDNKGERTQYICVFSDITLSKLYQENLERLAHFDALTGLPNRMLLANRMSQAMQQARREQRLLAVCYLDLDDFKPINDRFGHGVGDSLLIEITQRLLGVTATGDTVSRLGGDEFVLLLTQIDSAGDCEQIASRILTRISQPATIAGNRLQVSGSIGITLYPVDDADADTLLRHADQAMYLAKADGRNRFRLHAPPSGRSSD